MTRFSSKKWSSVRIGKKDDGRRKLSDQDRVAIRILYKNGAGSHRELAKKFGVSKRLIQWTLHPERLKAFQEKVKEEKRWLKYYDKSKHKLYMRKHRVKLRAKLEKEAK